LADPALCGNSGKRIEQAGSARTFHGEGRASARP